jgi:hypothetical protein
VRAVAGGVVRNVANAVHVAVVELVNETPLCRTAVYSLTGIAMSPNEMVPLQIDLAIRVGRYLFGRSPNQGVPDVRRSLLIATLTPAGQSGPAPWFT